MTAAVVAADRVPIVVPLPAHPIDALEDGRIAASKTGGEAIFDNRLGIGIATDGIHQFHQGIGSIVKVLIKF